MTSTLAFSHDGSSYIAESSDIDVPVRLWRIEQGEKGGGRVSNRVEVTDSSERITLLKVATHRFLMTSLTATG